MLKRCVPVLFSLACLEKVTGETVPLDERFTVQATPSAGEDDTAAPGHQAVQHRAVEHKEVPPPMPFEDVEGDRVRVAGSIVSDLEGAVDLDVSTVDSSSEGGLKSEGKILISEPGPFEIQIPVMAGSLVLAAFQDINKDGPTEEDPYAELTIDIDETDMTDLELILVVGARGSATGGPAHENKEHFEAPPGHGSGKAQPSQGQPTNGDPFDGYEGTRTLVSGTLAYGGEGVIDMDLFQEDASAPGGRLLLGKLKKFAGPFEMEVPVSIERLEIDAFVDISGDGPSADDPRGGVKGLQVSSGPVSEVIINLSLPAEAPVKPPVDPGGTDLEEEFARTRVKGRETPSDDEGL